MFLLLFGSMLGSCIYSMVSLLMLLKCLMLNFSGVLLLVVMMCRLLLFFLVVVKLKFLLCRCIVMDMLLVVFWVFRFWVEVLRVMWVCLF